MKSYAKKYKVIAKVTTPGQRAGGFVRYNVNDLLKFTQFLDQNFARWRWFNVYAYQKDGTGEQLASFTNKDRPRDRFLQ
jgi:hypothetical protein